MPTQQTTTFIADDLEMSFTSADGGTFLRIPASDGKAFEAALPLPALLELRQLLSTLIKTAQKAEQAQVEMDRAVAGE